MKVTKKIARKEVYVLAKVPEKLHRYIKSEAALLEVKINDIVVQALELWQENRG